MENISKNFTPGFSTSEVALVTMNDQKMVKKTFKNKSDFYKTLKVMEKLKDYHFIPKIYKVDKNSFTIYMDYCGEALHMKNKPNNWFQQVNYMEDCLKKENVSPNDINSKSSNTFPNICVKDKVLYLIDFCNFTEPFEEHIFIFLKRNLRITQKHQYKVKMLVSGQPT